MTDTKERGHWSQWVTTVLGMLWLALFPMWQDGSYSRITHSKWMGTLLLTGLTVITCGYMLVKLIRQGGWRRLRLSWVHMAAAAYFALVALSAAFGSYADHSGDEERLTVIWGTQRCEGLITQGCYGLIFLCLSLTRVRLRYLLDAAGLALLVFCGIVALQYQGINVLDLFPVGTSIYTNYEFQGAIGNIDMVVGYVSVAMPLLLGAFVWLPRPGWLWLISGLAGALLTLCMEVQCGLIMLALLLFAVLLAAMRNPESRWRAMLVWGGTMVMASAWLLLGMPWLDGTEELIFPHAYAWWKLLPAAAGVLLIALAPVIRRWKGGPMYRVEVAFVGAGLALLALVAVYTLPIPEGNGLWELQEIMHGRGQDAFGSERMGVWRMTLDMSRDSLLWGTGPDTFRYAFDDYLYFTHQSLLQTFDNPHNLVLGVLAGSGLPAAVMYVVLCAGPVIWGLCRAGKDATVLPLALAVMCYLVQGMFTFSVCVVTPVFWAALGMLTGQLLPEMEERKDARNLESDSELCIPPHGDECDQAGDAGAADPGADC